MKELSEELMSKYTQLGFENLTTEEQKKIVDYIIQIPQYVAEHFSKMVQEMFVYLESKQILVRNDPNPDWILSDKQVMEMYERAKTSLESIPEENRDSEKLILAKASER